MKKVSFLLLFILLSFSIVSCKNNTAETESEQTRLKVSVTFNAIEEFARAVGGDKVEITTIIPSGMEPHDFEPKVADIATLSKSDVFINNGLGMEIWTEDALKIVANKDLVVIDASKNASPIENTKEEDISKHGSLDPHLWLSIKGAEIEVQNIADGFSKADPVNKEVYQNNAANYLKQLEDLYLEYNQKFSTLSNKNFVTGHAAFQYFCRDFGLEQNSVEDVFAEGEPSTKQLADLVDYCKDKNVTTIFTEELASPEISQTLANEVGAKVETVYTMESADTNMSYLQRMKDNCKKIYESLSKE